MSAFSSASSATSVCTKLAAWQRRRASVSPASRRRPAMTTVAPSSTKSSTVRAPIPLVPPTMIATLPSSTPIVFFSPAFVLHVLPLHPGRSRQACLPAVFYFLREVDPQRELGEGAPPEPERPPSSMMWVPVMLADNGEHRYSTVFATSSAVV